VTIKKTKCSLETHRVREAKLSKEREHVHENSLGNVMERVAAHYAERLQQNQDQLAGEKEKEALRNWQMAKPHESQRISEVIELCGKQACSPPPTAVLPAAARSCPAPELARTAPLRTGLLTETSAGHSFRTLILDARAIRVTPSPHVYRLCQR
jgi:cell pole-organizing protein PopZ